jgi:hypothetical protein
MRSEGLYSHNNERSNGCDQLYSHNNERSNGCDRIGYIVIIMKGQMDAIG